MAIEVEGSAAACFCLVTMAWLEPSRHRPKKKRKMRLGPAQRRTAPPPAPISSCTTLTPTLNEIDGKVEWEVKGPAVACSCLVKGHDFSRADTAQKKAKNEARSG